MTTATAPRPTTETPPPSIQKYGEIVLQKGFTQHPHAVTDYLIHLGLHPREILYIQALESFRWEAGQEVFPSVRTIAEKIGVGDRQVRKISAKVEKMGLIKKDPDSHPNGAQLTNRYSLETLYNKVAAWLNEDVAVALAEQEAKEQEPFQPTDILDETAQAIAQEYGEPTNPEMHRHARRFHQYWYRINRGQPGDWETFADLVEQAIQQVQERKEKPTRAGKAFTMLIPYFFSALDWLINRSQHAEATLPIPETSPAEHTRPPQTQLKRQIPQGEPPKKSGILAERVAARKAAEAKGQPKVQPPEKLALHIAAISNTFHDQQQQSSLRRAANLWHDSRLDEETVLQLVAEARSEASKCTQIKTRTKHGAINRMPYFFKRLESRIEALLEK